MRLCILAYAKNIKVFEFIRIYYHFSNAEYRIFISWRR